MDMIPDSELILHPDGGIYHLGLLPEDLAPIVITVGDQYRVQEVSKYFERIEVDKQHREFKTHTGWYLGKRITVISTGIGTDNIDIVCNELDALVNIDFDTRKVKRKHTALTLIRVGTCGGVQPTIPVDGLFVAERAIGFENLLYFYNNIDFLDETFSEELVKQLDGNANQSKPYVVNAHPDLLQRFDSAEFQKGITATNVGFYGPQGRKLRLTLHDEQWNSKVRNFRWKEAAIDAMEMETSALYGMARLLGHKALSVNVVLANRALGTFSDRPKEAMDRLIKTTLDLLVI